jgi:uncharacterized OsmC-like protein
MSTTQNPVDNGVNVEALLGARDALADTPEIAKFQWRSKTTWVRGTHSQSSIDTFYGLCGEQQHKVTTTHEADHPEIFASEDKGPTPAEYVLVALGSCLTAGVAAVAQNRQIQLNSVTATIEASMDLHGILGADPDVRNGFSDITVTYDIDADADRAAIEALVAQSQKRSAVFDALSNPTNIAVAVS